MSIDNDLGWRRNGLNVSTPQTGDSWRVANWEVGCCLLPGERKSTRNPIHSVQWWQRKSQTFPILIRRVMFSDMLRLTCLAYRCTLKITKREQNQVTYPCPYSVSLESKHKPSYCVTDVPIWVNDRNISDYYWPLPMFVWRTPRPPSRYMPRGKDVKLRLKCSGRQWPLLV